MIGVAEKFLERLEKTTTDVESAVWELVRDFDLGEEIGRLLLDIVKKIEEFFAVEKIWVVYEKNQIRSED